MDSHTNRLVDDAQERYGWTDTALLGVLTDYIANQDSDEALAGYLAERGPEEADDEPEASPPKHAGQPRACPSEAVPPGGLWKTTAIIWSDYPGDQIELSALARQAETGDAYCSFDRSAFIRDPAADPAWDGTEFFGTRMPGVLLLCDGCYQAAVGRLAECEDGCPQDLDHTGLCLQESTDECQWCGVEDRLHQARRADIEHLLPTVGEENEGQWFLHWPGARKGPYPSAQAAWDAWHAHGDTTVPGKTGS